MKRLAAAAFAFAFAVALRPAPAYAGPPFQVDDPEPVAYRNYELYASSQYVHGAGAIAATLPTLEINYGALPNVQVSLAMQLAGNRSSRSEPWRTGYGDTTLGVKLRFVQESAGRPQIAFYPAVVLPTGDAAGGLGGGQTKLFLPLWLQKDVGGWTVFGGGGWWRNPGPGNRDYTFGGIAAQRQTSRTVAYGAELFHATADTIDGRGSTGFSVGTTRALGEHRALLFSVGRDLGGGTALNVFAAYKLELGRVRTAGAPPGAQE